MPHFVKVSMTDIVHTGSIDTFSHVPSAKVPLLLSHHKSDLLKLFITVTFCSFFQTEDGWETWE